ncbi:MAG: HAD family hydrolase [Clostridiales bacterium]|nr:HAD family hydrolase [Clostridiales bacterium]
MDGVIYHGSTLLPGAKEFVDWLQKEEKDFLFLTNNSSKTRKELQMKLQTMGINVEEKHFYTSALATASFLRKQCPGGSAYVIGDTGLTNAMYNVGFLMNNADPDYVVLGETRTYNYEMMEKATQLVMKGAKLIGCNYDVTGPVDGGIAPATRALISPIEMASGKQAYFVGKPNPLMMRHGLNTLDVANEDAVIIGDRMDTDIVAGIEAGIDTVLVLSGVTSIETMKEFAYRPRYIFDGVGDVIK